MNNNKKDENQTSKAKQKLETWDKNTFGRQKSWKDIYMKQWGNDPWPPPWATPRHRACSACWSAPCFPPVVLQPSSCPTKSFAPFFRNRFWEPLLTVDQLLLRNLPQSQGNSLHFHFPKIKKQKYLQLSWAHKNPKIPLKGIKKSFLPSQQHC